MFVFFNLRTYLNQTYKMFLQNLEVTEPPGFNLIPKYTLPGYKYADSIDQVYALDSSPCPPIFSYQFLVKMLFTERKKTKGNWKSDFWESQSLFRVAAFWAASPVVLEALNFLH